MKGKRLVVRQGKLHIKAAIHAQNDTPFKDPKTVQHPQKDGEQQLHPQHILRTPPP